MTEEERIASWGAWSGLEHHPWCNYPDKPLGERRCNCPVGAKLYEGHTAKLMLHNLSAHIQQELGREFEAEEQPSFRDLLENMRRKYDA